MKLYHSAQGYFETKVQPYSPSGKAKPRLMARDRQGRFITSVSDTGRRKRDIALLNERVADRYRERLKKVQLKAAAVKKEKAPSKLNIYNLRVNCILLNKGRRRPSETTKFYFDMHFPSFRTTESPEGITQNHEMFGQAIGTALSLMNVEHGLKGRPSPEYEIDSIGIEFIAGEEEYQEHVTDSYTFTMYYPEGDEYYTRKGEFSHDT